MQLLLNTNIIILLQDFEMFKYKLNAKNTVTKYTLYKNLKFVVQIVPSILLSICKAQSRNWQSFLVTILLLRESKASTLRDT